MEKTYIFGHRKPDTDSVCASIALSYLKNKLGMNTEARVIGTINNETRYVLKYFNVDEPLYLNDVKVQVNNINYQKNVVLNDNASILKAFNFMNKNNVTALPLIDDRGTLNGLITLKEIGKDLVQGDLNKLATSYVNILETINGQEILKFDEEIVGTLMVAAFKSESFIHQVQLQADNVLIVGDRYNIIKKALDEKIKLLIVVGGHKLHEDLIALARDNKVNIIYTDYETYETASKIRLANYIKSIKVTEEPITFDIHDYRTEIMEEINKYGHTTYPIVNKKNKCLGLLKVTNTYSYEKMNVILVDHNQKAQSVEGIDEANILEVIDHHNLSTIWTSSPISFRSMPVGSTCTIIYKLYEENNIAIPYDIAGLMLAAILSDTMIFKSPTTTEIDKEVATKLSEMTKIDVEQFGYNMFKTGSTIKGMTPEEVFNQDLKNYKVGDESMVISQVFTMDYDDIRQDLNSYITVLNNLAAQGYKVAVMFITDVIKNGSYIIFNDNAKEIIEESYNIDNVYQGIYMQDLVSRKKQLVPNIMEAMQRKI